jgi:two-component system, sensor histidine kinase
VACVVSPNAADADLAVELLGHAGISARAFASLRELAQALDERAGCAIVVEEALVEEELPLLREALGRLPAWCDLPLILVARDVAALGQMASTAFPSSGNVTLLERPLNPHTLASGVQVALRATARQREVGELLGQRERAVKARDEFLAMLAHELRNPLAPMRNAVYMLRTIETEDPTLLKSAAIVERQVTHMVRMVDDLMDVARLERGKVVLRRQRVNLNSVVSSGIESCVATAQAKGHRISLSFATELLTVDGDPVRLEQIVCNLVNNAIKFSPDGQEVRVETRASGDAAELVVIDRGVGFEPGAAEQLFDPFLQVNPTIERTAGGLGMGLTIVRRLAELHGGSVRAESEGPGKGSRFIVQLPLSAGAAESALGAGSERRHARQKPRRVVVIDDNVDIRESMRMLMKLWGHQVALAADGREGVELVFKERPEVALIDIGLPGMNGYEVARAIREKVPNGDLRLIAVTGYGQPADRELALQAGFDAHLLKPVHPEALQKLLAE